MAEPMSEGGGRVEQAVLDYFTRVESGEIGSAEDHLAGLDARERQEFREYLALADEVRREFPRRRAGMVLGGRYELVGELGQGGMGEVWAARDRQVGREVAVKILAAAAVNTPEAREFLEREREALGRLKHPGIVAIHDAHLEFDPAYLVMERVVGRSLDDLLHDLRSRCAGGFREPTTADLEQAIGSGAPPGRQALMEGRSYYRTVARIGIEILRTLEAAHGANVVHRDIKPANIMFTGGGHPVLLDFGLAAVRPERTGALTSRLFGTVNYVAPEQLAGQQAGKDPRTDLYQFGLVLYAMLTLEDAFDPHGEDTLQDIREGRVRSAREVRPSVPWELERICAQAMAADPTRRYPTAQAFREDLERFLGGRELPMACRREGGGEGRKRALLYFARRRWPVLVVAAALLVAVLPSVVFGSGLDVTITVYEQAADQLVLDVESSRESYLMFVPQHGDGFALAGPREAGESGGDRWIVGLKAGHNRVTLVPRSPVGFDQIDRRRLAVDSYASSERARLAKLADACELMEEWIELDATGRKIVPAAVARRIFANLDQTRRGGPAVDRATYDALTTEQVFANNSLAGTGVERPTVKL
jgi:tRNA A-37 threonylcarbamoyl transferase component Bud32